MLNTQQSGFFISFEGVDGAGKSSHMERVRQHLDSLGIECVQTREPGGTPVGEAIRELVLHHDMDINTELLLMYAARRQHVVQTIAPALARGAWVISDRFEDSSFAYQASAGGAVWEDCVKLSKWALKGFEPALTFLFDLPIAVSQARIQARAGQGDKFEGKPISYFEAVRAGFIRRAQINPTRVRLIDAEPDETTVAKAVLAELDRFIHTHLKKAKR
ncbi:dTMP kinase [Limnobacter humi]|uniref:Thymidylate kinase n=1 Tax=Limnobacter humi TaxID=1778671 RepID=A0ABT1WEK4_9BURK|nr:dTMP kinase [Limnobacter humi]